MGHFYRAIKKTFLLAVVDCVSGIKISVLEIPQGLRLHSLFPYFCLFFIFICKNVFLLKQPRRDKAYPQREVINHSKGSESFDFWLTPGNSVFQGITFC